MNEPVGQRVERKSMELHYRMRELPDSERPYERCQQYGAEVLSDAELLAVILRTGNRNCSALQLAQNILCLGQQSLLNLHQLSVEDLQSLPGIGKVKALQLKCVAELSKRMAAACYQRALTVDSPETLAGYYMERFRHEPREQLLLAMFDTRNRLLADQVLSVGTVNASLVSPREIFQRALQSRAVHIVLLHNHPGGDPAPSREDIRVTERIREAGELLGIMLTDHIIIGDNRYFSFREMEILN